MKNIQKAFNEYQLDGCVISIVTSEGEKAVSTYGHIQKCGANFIIVKIDDKFDYFSYFYAKPVRCFFIVVRAGQIRALFDQKPGKIRVLCSSNLNRKSGPNPGSGHSWIENNPGKNLTFHHQFLTKRKYRDPRQNDDFVRYCPTFIWTL